LNREEWFYLPSKQSPGFSGDPVAAYYEPHLIGSNPFGYLYTDVNQAQDVTKYLVIGYIREIQDLKDPTDIIELPKEWYRAYLYELSFDLCDDFNAIWSQSNETKRQASIAIAAKSNPPTSSRGFVPGYDVFIQGDGQRSR
jgi:hypothetical protein